MPKEIERKFLVNSDAYKKGNTPLLIQQGFISTEKNSIVRIRIQDDQAFLTIKNSGTGPTRNEFEYSIPLDDARELISSICIKPTIKKYRFKVIHEGHVWEIDEFLDDNEGLVVAEIELQSETESFIRPPWLGVEVTHDARYYNARLIKYPYKMWITK